MACYEISNKRDKDIYDVYIKGEIGKDFTGLQIAEEIRRLNEIGAKQIIEHINSPGGNIIQGYDIVTANLQSEAEITTINEGVAASMAAVILVSGKVRKCYDFSTALIHDPLLNGESLESIEDENDRSNMRKYKTGIVTVLKAATGQEEKLINELMTRETAFSAKEQKKFNLVHEVIKTNISRPANMNLKELTNHFNNTDLLNLSKTLKMNELTNFLQLSNEASENSIINKVKEIIGVKDEQIKNLENVQNENAQLKQDLQAANEKLEANKKVTIAAAVNAAIDSGKFVEDQRTKLTEAASKDLELFNTMVEATPTMHKSALNELNNSAGNNSGQEVKDWAYYEKNDPRFLQNLEKTNPAEFKRLLEEDNKQYS